MKKLPREFYDICFPGTTMPLSAYHCDYARALRVIAAGKVALKTRSRKHYSISGSEGVSRAIGHLIYAGLAEHDPIKGGGQTLTVRLTEEAKKYLAHIEDSET